MWKRWLTDNGVRVTGPYDRGYFTSIYFTDPDGQVIEIATDGPGFQVDEPADALGRDADGSPAKPIPGGARRGRDPRQDLAGADRGADRRRCAYTVSTTSPV